MGWKDESSMRFPKITCTMTMGRRLDMFMTTMESFMECCLDLDLIDRWVVNDDRSSAEDLRIIKEKFPFLEIIKADRPGQAAALNNLFNQVDTEFTYHHEDDWQYMRKCHFIRNCFDIMATDSRIKNVILRKWDGIYTRVGNVEYRLHIYDPNLAPKIAEINNFQWYGYSLNPGIQHIPTIYRLGEYRVAKAGDNVAARHFDRPVAYKYMKLGLLRASVIEKHIEHIGWSESIYDLKETWIK